MDTRSRGEDELGQMDETFYLLEQKPSLNLKENECFHPLFEHYETMLNETLPLYEDISNVSVMEFLDFHIGITN